MQIQNGFCQLNHESIYRIASTIVLKLLKALKGVRPIDLKGVRARLEEQISQVLNHGDAVCLDPEYCYTTPIHGSVVNDS